MTPAAIQGNYADLKFIKGRKCCQIIIEIPIEAADSFLRMFGAPIPASEIPVALARLDREQPSKKLAEHRKWQTLPQPQQAALRCEQEAFWRFLTEEHGRPAINSEQAAMHVRSLCGVSSRSKLSQDPEAGGRWRTIDDAFQAWMRAA